MKRLLIVLTGLACLGSGGYIGWYCLLREEAYYEDYSPWIALGLPIGLIILAFVFFAWACSDNIYNIKQGKVVGHDFTPAHMTPTTVIAGTPATKYSPGTPTQVIPGHWVPDDWALCLEDDQGRTGWLHFAEDPRPAYPYNSYYPRPQVTSEYPSYPPAQ